MRSILLGLVIGGLLLVVMSLGGCLTLPHPENTTVNLTYVPTVGDMPRLLQRGEVDAYFVWHPYDVIEPLTGTGRVAVYSGDFPPAGRWRDHPCCVLVARSEYVQKNPALTESILSVLIRSSEFATAHPGESANTVATWLGGMKGQTFTEPDVYNSEVLAGSDPSMKYSTEPTAQWREGILRFVYAMRGQGTLMGRLRDSQDQNTLAMLLDPAPSMRAHEDLASGGLLQVPDLGGSVRIGYLPTNHHASLFIAVMQGEEVEGAYGSLQPQGDGSLTPKQASLIFGNRSAAEIHLVPARNGKELMDLLANGTLDLALSGTVPVIQAIDQGVPIGILMPVNTEGSGLVVRNDSPAKDWKSLLKWAQERSDAGEDITIAVPGKGTIQDIMIRYAFNISEVSVRPTI